MFLRRIESDVPFGTRSSAQSCAGKNSRGRRYGWPPNPLPSDTHHMGDTARNASMLPESRSTINYHRFVLRHRSTSGLIINSLRIINNIARRRIIKTPVLKWQRKTEHKQYRLRPQNSTAEYKPPKKIREAPVSSAEAAFDIDSYRLFFISHVSYVRAMPMYGGEGRGEQQQRFSCSRLLADDIGSLGEVSVTDERCLAQVNDADASFRPSGAVKARRQMRPAVSLELLL